MVDHEGEKKVGNRRTLRAVGRVPKTLGDKVDRVV
jgi:hypothetical protein